MNDLMLGLGLAHFKPLIATLLLPPVPLLLLIVLGALQVRPRPVLGWLLLLLGLLGAWMSCTTALGRGLTLGLLRPAPALSAKAVADLRGSPSTAIVILGGGRRHSAPEFGTATLNARSLERLRYGIWLGRETGLPVAFSGGVGRAEPVGPGEAELASDIAKAEFKAPLRWLETSSRDTHENAFRSVALLRAQGITRIVLVTHAYHMPRAQRNFERAAASVLPTGQERGLTITAAPLGRPTLTPLKLRDWMPSLGGFDANHLALHELLGLALGA